MIRSFPLTSFLSIKLTRHLFSIAPLAIALLLTYSCSLLSLAFPCFWEVSQDLGSGHLPIILTVPFSPPQRTSPFFNFQKARWHGIAFYFDSHCLSIEEYSSFSLSFSNFSRLLQTPSRPLPLAQTKSLISY